MLVLFAWWLFFWTNPLFFILVLFFCSIFDFFFKSLFLRIFENFETTFVLGVSNYNEPIQNSNCNFDSKHRGLNSIIGSYKGQWICNKKQHWKVMFDAWFQCSEMMIVRDSDLAINKYEFVFEGGPMGFIVVIGWSMAIIEISNFG